MRRVPIIVTALAGHTQEHSQSMLVRHTIQIGGWPRPPLPRSMISFVRLGVNRAMNCGIETCAPDHVRHGPESQELPLISDRDLNALQTYVKLRLRDHHLRARYVMP